MNDRRRALLLAAMANCNLQTAQRILADGPDACRALAFRDHARRVLALMPKVERIVLKQCG